MIVRGMGGKPENVNVGDKIGCVCVRGKKKKKKKFLTLIK